MAHQRNASCSFCRKSYRDVGPLVEGPDKVYICLDCAELCLAIVEQEKRRRGQAVDASKLDANLIRDQLARLLPRQQPVAAALSQIIAHRGEIAGRVLLLGSSRSSGILIAKAIAHISNAHFAIGDVDGLATTGKGNVIFDLVTAADFDTAKAARGVVYIGGMERTEGQDAVLKLWESKTWSFAEGVAIDVSGVFFVCAAAFAGTTAAEPSATAADLIARGARSTWASRLTAILPIAPLDDDSLAAVLAHVDLRYLLA
jgi:ATP-dependent Clp protease ATP-binding subunit ClpX